MTTTILTVQLDAASQVKFDALRQTHYPAALNQIAAHLTLFHTLPASEEVHVVLRDEAAALAAFAMRVSGVHSLGRGVAYALESRTLRSLHARLAAAYKEELSAQDRQGFRPHVVVQNKVSPENAKALLVELSANFVEWEVQATGIAWWDYLDGPWRLRQVYPFQ